MNFYMAMRASISVRNHVRPYLESDQYSQFVVVARTSNNNQFLTIAETGVCAAQATPISSNIQSLAAMVGTLIESDACEGIERFILSRHLPEGVICDGAFCPAEGIAVVSTGFHGHSLEMWCRKASLGQLGETAAEQAGRQVPAMIIGATATWRLSAKHVSWERELLPAI